MHACIYFSTGYTCPWDRRVMGSFLMRSDRARVSLYSTQYLRASKLSSYSVSCAHPADGAEASTRHQKSLISVGVFSRHDQRHASSAGK